MTTLANMLEAVSVLMGEGFAAALQESISEQINNGIDAYVSLSAPQ